MEIIVGKTAGFCGGVARAVEGAKKELEKADKAQERIYCLGELVHNKEVIKSLEESGLETIENIEKANGKVIIRAHGVTKQMYDYAEKNGITLIDLTCTKVLKVHDMAKEYAKKDYYIFLLGDKQHPEVIGTYSYCGQKASKIENLEDIDMALQEFNNSKKNKLAILSQTTFSMEKFDAILEEVQRKIGKEVELEIEKTICMATKLRQEEVEKIAKQVEAMIVIGGKNSSNSIKLYELAKKNCENVLFVQTKKEIDLAKLKAYEKIGIMAGASTPKESIEDVIQYIK